MKALNQLLLCIILSLCSLGELYPQSFVGYGTGDFSGAHGVLFNPAQLAGSKPKKFDVNVFSVSAFVGSDLLDMGLSDLTSMRNGFGFNSATAQNTLSLSNFYGNIDILGPSLYYHIDGKNSVGINTRVRAFFNLHNISGGLYELIYASEPIQQNFNLEMKDLSGLIHAWGEIGATYSRVLIEDTGHRLKAGATLKYLGGAGGVFSYSDRIRADFNASIYTLTTSGNLNYGHTASFENDEVSFSDLTSGIGADLGLVYEYRAGGSSEADPYTLRIGVAVTDLGEINYRGVSNYSYTMNATIDASQFGIRDLEEILEENYPSFQLEPSQKLGLPTALRFFGDYRIDHNFSIAAQGAFSLKNPAEQYVSKIINHGTLTPRYDRKWIGLYSPIGIRQYETNLTWGLGVRIGPILIGSGSVLSNLIAPSSRSADAYVGLRLAI